MSISMESLAREIESSINKPLSGVSGELDEYLAKCKYSKDETMNKSIKNGESNEPRYMSCNQAKRCHYCFQIDLLTLFSLALIAILDTCFRFGHAILGNMRNQIYDLLQYHLNLYRNNGNARRYINVACAILLTLVYVQVHLITSFLSCILKPIPKRVCQQVHDLFSNSQFEGIAGNGQATNEVYWWHQTMNWLSKLISITKSPLISWEAEACVGLFKWKIKLDIKFNQGLFSSNIDFDVAPFKTTDIHCSIWYARLIGNSVALIEVKR